VPIGAGLDKVVKKKKPKKPVKYREPGSATGLLSISLIALVGGFGYLQKPWENNFEPIRVMFGATPTPKVEGDWEIVKVVSLEKPTQMSSSETTQGKYSFHQGKAKIELVADNQPFKAQANYTQDGSYMVMTGFKTDPNCEMPPSVQVSLIEQGEDQLIASYLKGGTVHLRRMSAARKIGTTLGYKLLGETMKPEADEE
jgi:hypothetical protein